LHYEKALGKYNRVGHIFKILELAAKTTPEIARKAQRYTFSASANA